MIRIFSFIFQFFYLLLGKVVIDAFRLINPNMMVLGQEPRQTTSNLGHLQKPSVQVCSFFRLLVINNLLRTILEHFLTIFAGVNSRLEQTLLFHVDKL